MRAVVRRWSRCRRRARSSPGPGGWPEEQGDSTTPSCIDLIRALEELKCAAEGAQAEATAAFDRSQRAAAARRGVPQERQGRGIPEQVALARRESPHRGKRHVGLAKVLPAELPCAYEAFRAGRVSEWKVSLLARETACLSLEHRMLVDEAIAGDAARFEAMGRPRAGGRGARPGVPVRPGVRGRAAPSRGGRPTHDAPSGSRHHDLARRAVAGQGRRRGAQGPARRGRPAQGGR